MTAGRSIAAELHQMSQILGGPGSSPYLITPSETQPRYSGTPAPMLLNRYVTLPSGLIVPQAAAAQPVPLDFMLTYITAKEVLGRELPLEVAVDALARVPIEDVLRWVASWTHGINHPGADRRAVDAAFAQGMPPGQTLEIVVNLLRDPRRALVTSQALLVMAKWASAVCGDAVTPLASQGANLAAVMLIVADHLDDGRDRSEAQQVVTKVPGELGRELIANQLHNRKQNEISVVARFGRRWLEMPDELAADSRVIDLADAYQRATGIDFRDFLAIGMLFWLRAAVNGELATGRDYFDELNWDSDRVDRILDMLTIDIPNLRVAIAEDAERYGLSWSTTVFERYPIIKMHDGTYLVIDPRLLLHRIFGLLPLFDTQDGLKRAGARSAEIDRVGGCFAHLAEAYVIEILRRLAGPTTNRVFADDALKAAYAARGVKVADAAIQYAASWVVVEVTTSRPTRATVMGLSDDAFVHDVSKLVEEAKQIEATIASLRVDESRLTGIAATGPRTFYPVVVATEGFPINPITLSLFRERLADEEVLQDADTRPVELLDLEELEMIEAVHEAGGLSLCDLLHAKAAGSMANAGIREYLISNRTVEIQPSATITQQWKSTMEGITRYALANVDPPTDDEASDA